MSARFLCRFIGGIAAAVLIMRLGHGRIPEAAVNGLAFTAMFLIMPISFDKNPGGDVPFWRRASGAVLGGATVAALNLLLGPWHS